MNLIEGIHQQCNRLRGELIPQYESIGPTGGFAIACMRGSIANAEAAVASGDVAKMVAAYKDLEGFNS
jgi:hypothetical protein